MKRTIFLFLLLLFAQTAHAQFGTPTQMRFMGNRPTVQGDAMPCDPTRFTLYYDTTIQKVKVCIGVNTWGLLAGVAGGGNGGDALTMQPLSQFAATTSAQFAGVITNKTGTGSIVFGTSPNITTPTGIVKADVGLSAVDNTSDANKPLSSAATTALSGKEPIITAGTSAQYYRGDKTFQTLNKAAVGLTNADDTSDATKNAATATLTNKAISGSSNTLSSIPQSAITNLSSDLAAKQAALSSGVNIKTLNGNSLVGSGDLVVPGNLIAVYYSGITTKAGDTLTNPTTRTAFASKWTMPASSVAVGDLFRLDFYGRYQVPTGAVSPVANPCLQIGGANVLCTGNLSVGVGTGNNYGFKSTVYLVVRTTGSSCIIAPFGDLTFQLTGGGAPTQAGLIPDTGVFTGNCNNALDWTLTNLTSNNPGQSFTLDFMQIQKAAKPVAAN